MKQLVGVALLAALSCAPAPGATAKLWTVEDFFARQGTGADFGGWSPDELVSSTAGKGELTVFPAFSNSKSAAYVITEIWSNHPLPWLQPVWALVGEDRPAAPSSARLKDADGKALNVIFPVGVTATFYSPFWVNRFVLAPADTSNTTYQSAKALLDAQLPTRAGGLVLCPIVPNDDVRVFRPVGAAGPVHPFTGAALANPGTFHAWVEGKQVAYLGVGANRAPWHDDVVEEAPLYVFVTAARVNGQEVHQRLPLPAVLPDEALTHSLLRRVDVVLPSSAAVFVPDHLAAMRAELEARGVSAPPVGAGLPEATAKEYALRVAADGACFLDAGFPATCTWWDHEAAFATLGGQPTEVLLTAATLAQVGP